MSGNRNVIVTDGWSNPASKRLYDTNWPDEPALQVQHEVGGQCGGCSFFAAFDTDWGLCCQAASRHHLETVFEHFACPHYVHEGWGPHSFTADPSFHCLCGGNGTDYWDSIARIFE